MLVKYYVVYEKKVFIVSSDILKKLFYIKNAEYLFHMKQTVFTLIIRSTWIKHILKLFIIFWSIFMLRTRVKNVENFL